MGTSRNNAARQAEENERRRQAQINQTTASINQIFDSPERQKQIADFGGAMRDFYLQDLNRQKASADRDLTFALARSGLTGGSRQVDATRSLGEDYQRGVLDAERRTQGAMADLRGRDEQARLSLTSLAQSGLSATNAATQAASAMRASLDGAQSAAQLQGLGDLFGGVADIRRRSEEARERRRADSNYTQRYGPSQWIFSGFSGGR